MTVDAGPREMRLGWRRGAAYLGRAFALAWHATWSATLVKAVLSLLAGVGPVALAWLTKLILDRLVGRAPVSQLIGYAVALGVVGVFVAVQAQLASYWDGILERALRAEVTGRLMAKVNSFAGLARLENPQFQDRLQIAQTTGRMAPSLCVGGGIGVAQGLLTMTGFVGSLFVISPWMMLIVVAAAAPTVWVELRLNRRRAFVTWRLGHAERREFFYENLQTSLEAAKEIRLFGLGDFFGARMLNELRHIHREQSAMDRRELAGQASLALLGSVIAAGGLVWVVTRASAGAINVGDVALFIAAMSGAQGAIASIIGQAGNVHQTLLTFDHYQAVMAAPLDLGRGSGAAAELTRGIRFHDVWFRYAEDQPWVLRGVDLFVPAGQSIGLVGVNGAGKSTIVKLLCRYYDPVRGHITWNGVDLRELDIAHLRARMSVVFQDFMSYDLPVHENVTVGDLARAEDRDRVEEVSKLAGCHDFVAALPGGYETMLSRLYVDNADKDDPETGVLLSGGQQQRLAVARALFRDQRDLLILDEPSAGLDAEAEHEIHSLLRDLRRGRTSVLISHRLSAVREADVIVVLEAGEIAEQGDHEKLLAMGGLYARLFGLQAQGYR